MRFVTIVTALLVPGFAAQAQVTNPGLRAGEVFEIRRHVERSQQDSSGMTGESSDTDTIQERVIAVSAEGVELALDHPDAATAQDRDRDWMLPARIFVRRGGQPQLRNRPELEARLDAWLKRGELTRANCGQWHFSWTAFKIECDPETVLQIFDSFDLDAATLSDGASYQAEGATAAAPLRREGSRFVAELAIDPEAVRRDRAEADVVIAQLNRKPIALDDALRAHAGEAITGTITVTFETTTEGRAWRRTTVTKRVTHKPDGTTLTETATETIERKPVSRDDEA